MVNLKPEHLIEILQEPFSYRDGKWGKFWTNFCKTVLIFRYMYMSIPFIVKVAIGLPLLFYGKGVCLAYMLFVIWSLFLDKFYHYNFSEDKFYFREYFKTYFLKNILYFLTAYFMYKYYFFKFGWLCFMYSIPMLLITFGYVLPIFDKRIYSENEQR